MSPAPDPQDLSSLSTVVQLVAYVTGVFGTVFLALLLADRHAHAGASWFKRRRVLRLGEEARAKVLSCTPLPGRFTGSNHTMAYSLIYEVVPVSGQPFRARGHVVASYGSQSEGYALSVGSETDVRFDVTDLTVVQVPRNVKEWKRKREADRLAREEELLRGDESDG